MTTPARVLAVIDRIAHPSVNGHDLEGSVAGLRRLLGDQTPSAILAQSAPAAPRRAKHVSYDALQEALAATRVAEQERDAAQGKLAVARAKLAAAGDTIRTLETELAEARLEIERLQTAQNDTGADVPYHLDVWLGKLAAFLKAHPAAWRFTTAELLSAVGGNAKRLTPVMTSLGWTASTNVPIGNGRRTRGYVRFSDPRAEAA